MMDKLNKKAEKMRLHFSQIKNDFELKYPVIKEFVIKEYGISPTSEMFANWYFDERYFPTKNNYRLGVKITNKDILDFCSEYFQELKTEYSQELKTEHSQELKIKTQNTPTDPSDEIISKISEILEAFFSAFNSNEKLVSTLIDDIKIILLEGKSPEPINKIYNNEIHFKAESIRFCFYNIYLLKKQKLVKDLLVIYLHKKFSLFDNLDFNEKNISQSTTHKKFSTKPMYYPK